MQTLVLPVSRGCPNQCVFCDVAPRLDGARVPAPGIKQAIDDARAAGAVRVVLTGGEPLLGRHVLRAIGYAHGIGMRTAVSTSGRLLSDPGILGRLEAAGLDEAAIGLHSVDPAIHTTLTGDPAAHPQTLTGLRAAAASSLHTTLRTVLTAHNLDEVEALVDLAAELGIAFELRNVRPEGRATEVEGVVPRPSDALSALSRALHRAEARGVPLTFSGFGPLPRLGWPSTGAGPAPDDALHQRLLREGAWTAALRRELPTTLRAHLEVPSVLLRAQGLPVARPARGPALSDAHPVHVVADLAPDDVIAAASGLTGLATALEQRGLVVGQHKAWRAPEADDGLPGVSAKGGLFASLRRDPRPDVPWEAEDDGLLAACKALVDGMDLGGAGTVIVRGLRMAAHVRARPRLPRRLRLIVLDADPRDDVPFEPGPEDTLVCPLPMVLDRWPARGVPLEQVLSWPPLVDPRPVPSVAAEDDVVVLGGPCLDLDLARGVIDALPGPHHVLGGAPSDLGPAAPTDPRAQFALLGRARWLVVPHDDSAPDPATMAWLMRAAVAGLPVIATATPAVDAVYGRGTGHVVAQGDVLGMRRVLTEVAAGPPEAWRAMRAALEPTRRLASPDRLAHVLIQGHAADDEPVQGPVGPW